MGGISFIMGIMAIKGAGCEAGPAQRTTGRLVSPRRRPTAARHIWCLSMDNVRTDGAVWLLRPVSKTHADSGFFFLFLFFFARSSEGAGGGLRKKKRAPFFVWLLTLERKQEILREGVLVSGQRSCEVIRDLVWRNRTEETHT